ncbi:MAG TPA: GrpB family protein [bacterium]|nr:GrpB family protein [bacterium]
MEGMKKTYRDSAHENILPYNPEWVRLYEAEAEKLREVFGAELLGLEHIGSSSVPGLSAKPIIDIMALIDSHENAEKFIPKLQELGYSFDFTAETDKSTERHLFRKGKPTQYHLSIAYADRGSFWKRQLAFRDYLREHPEERDRYAKLKQRLIKEDPTGKDLYIKGKTDLVNEILDKSGFVRWKPPTKKDQNDV